MTSAPASAVVAPEADAARAPGPSQFFDRRRAAAMILVACAVIAIGIVVYLRDRDLSRSAWIPDVLALGGGALFGASARWLPSFAHVLAFSLLTASLLPRLYAYRCCGAWAAIDIAFEVGQHPTVRAAIGQSIETAFGTSHLATVAARYFTHGTFDPGDITAAVAGAVAAATTLAYIEFSRSFNRGR